MSVAVVRVRGTPGVRGDIRETLQLLHLTRPNHCTVVPLTQEFQGMLRKAEDYVTWGDPQPEVLTRLLVERGRVTGDAPLSKTYVKKTLGYDSIEALSQAILEEKVALHQLDGVKPLFRLSPPRRGYEGTKRAFRDGGALGERGEAINDLIQRML